MSLTRVVRPYKGDTGEAPIYGSVLLRLPHQGDRYPTDHHLGTTHKQTDPTKQPEESSEPRSVQVAWLLWFCSLQKSHISDIRFAKYSNFFLIFSNQRWVLIQCVAYLGMTGMSRWFFWGSRNPRKVERDQQCGRTGSSETMASQTSLPVAPLQCHLTIAKSVSLKS